MNPTTRTFAVKKINIDYAQVTLNGSECMVTVVLIFTEHRNCYAPNSSFRHLLQ